MYSKCSDGENSISGGSIRNTKNNNNIMGDIVESSNVNNIMQEEGSVGGGSSLVGVMNNNRNNSGVLSFASHGKSDAVGVTFCNTSSTIGFHNALDKESSNVYVNDKYISEISKSNILRHENNHYLSQPHSSRQPHLPEYYLNHPSNNSGSRYGEPFINVHNNERVLGNDTQDNEIGPNLTQKVITFY